MNVLNIESSCMHWLALAAGCLFAASAAGESATPSSRIPAQTAAGTSKAATKTPASKSSPYRAAAKLTPKAQTYYAAAWGVEKMRVSYTSSGNLVRFSYRVSDPARARPLADKASAPYLVSQKNRAVLQVPVMDKVGQLRQTAEPKAGLEYWMVFSNKGNLVRPGDRVNVMIGAFHADGLVVE